MQFSVPNDHMALTALGVVTFEFVGLTPGRDISVVGFDDIKMSGWPQFGLTTFSQPVDAMVSKVVDVLRLQLNDPSAKHEDYGVQVVN